MKKGGQSLVEFVIILFALTMVGVFIGTQFNTENGAPVSAQNTAIKNIADDVK